MNTSRKIRIGIGAGIFVAGLIFHADWWIIGMLPLITGIFNACPGGTCEVPQPKAKPGEIKEEIE